MPSSLHRRRLRVYLVAVLLVTAGIPASTVWVSEGTASSSDKGSIPVSDDATAYDIQTWVAPESAELSNLSEIDAAKASGNLTRTEVVAESDTLVLELRAAGLSSAIADRNESNATARFSAWLDADGVSLRVRETTPGASQRHLLVNVTDPDATTVVLGRDDTYYLVVDTETVSVTDDYEPTGEETDLRTSEYRANFTLTNESELVESRKSVEDEFEVRPRDAGVATGLGSNRVHVASAPNQSVPVKTTLAPGSQVTVVVEGPGDPFPFEATGRVRNGSDGLVFAPQFDFSDVSPGTEFTVTVSHPGESRIEYASLGHGVVTVPTASVEWRAVSEQDGSVTASLSRGGFVVVRRGSADGDLLGNSAYLEPGAEQTVLVPLDQDLDSNLTLVAVAVRDSDDDGQFDPETDEPYMTGNSDYRVVDSKSVAFGKAGESADGETTDGTTGSPVQTGTTTETVTGTGIPAEPSVPGVGSPGFGVGAALVALLVVAFLARRR